MKSWIHFLGGSVTVYLLMAACSAGGKRMGSNGTGGDEPSANAGSAASSGGAQATGGDAVANAGTSPLTGGTIGDVIDDVMDPVDDADAAPATSGTRLRARYYVGDDGSKQFVGWFDKERGEQCTVQVSEDGKLRCLPTVGGYSLFFADAACTQPLAYITPPVGCSQPSAPGYIADLSTFSCSAKFKVFRVRNEVTPASLYFKSGENCMATTVTAGYRYFDTVPVAASEFVGASEEIE